MAPALPFTGALSRRRALARRLGIGLALAGTLIGLLPWGHARADDSRPLRLVVPTQPGSQADAVARALSQAMGRSLGRPVVVENIAGAGGIPGTQQIVRAPKDGLTLGLVSSNHVINPSIYRALPFDPLKDITPITVIGTLPLVLVVNPAVPAATPRELVAWLKARPDQVNYGSSGNGTVLHLAGELFASEAGVHIRHVPYKGAGNYLTDLLSGQVQMGFLPLASALPQWKAGRLKVVAVSTAARVPMLPGVPTLAESGLPGYAFDAWLAIVGPAGLPAALASSLQQKIKAALDEPAVRATLAAQGVVINGSTPEQAAPFFHSELDKHARLVRAAGAALE